MADKRVILSDPLTQDRLFPAVIADNIFNADGSKFNPMVSDDVASADTKVLFGLGPDATPDDILALLGQNIYNGLGNQYLWKKIEEEDAYEYDELNMSSGTNIVTTNTTDGTVTYGTGFKVVNGKFVLTGTANKTFIFPDYDTNILKGKYIKQSLNGVEEETIYYIDPASSSSPSISYDTFCIKTTDTGKIYKNIRLNSNLKTFSYVNSSLSDAYPPTEPDGYVYVALGRLGGKSLVGEYIGTGTYGKDNPTSLTFDSLPSALIIISTRVQVYNDRGRPGIAFLSTTWGNGLVLTDSGGGSSGLTLYNVISVTHEGNSIYWYANELEGYGQTQLNTSGITYKYIALFQ